MGHLETVAAKTLVDESQTLLMREQLGGKLTIYANPFTRRAHMSELTRDGT